MPQVAKLSGEYTAAQPLEDELVGELRERLAKELEVPAERIGLLQGHLAVPDHKPVTDCGDSVIQVVRLPDGETMTGWTVRSLLSVMCSKDPALTATLEKASAEQRLEAVEIRRAAELTGAIRTIGVKALEEPEHSKVCADVARALNARWPFLRPTSDGGDEESQCTKFVDELNAFVREEFKALHVPFEELGHSDVPDDERADMCTRHRQRAFALMQFTGHLFARDLIQLAAPDTEQLGAEGIVYFLIGRDDRAPTDHQVECLCELVQVIGPKLDASPGGRSFLTTRILNRIVDVDAWAVGHLGHSFFSQPTIDRVAQLMDLRKSNWGRGLASFGYA